MALWPFGKKKREDAEEEAAVWEPTNRAPASADDTPVPAEDTGIVEEPSDQPPVADSEAAVEADGNDGAAVRPHDAIHGDSGPFDGDSVDMDEFDFSDFSAGVLNLGSMRIPMPKGSQVQLEMGETGPRMIHIVTEHGRITPVAFAAPKVSGQWEDASAELLEGIRGQGMETRYEPGPWGREIVGIGPKATMRVIGIDGPRWMLRMTLAAPTEKADALAELGRELAARTFVYRGQDPILAGNSLPVAVPSQLMQQVQQVMKQRQEQQRATQQQPPVQPSQASADKNALNEAAAALQALNNQNKPDPTGDNTPTQDDK